MSTHPNVDVDEIRGLVHRYADAASRREPAEVADTFTADGQWYSPGLGRFEGRDTMMSFFTSMLSGWNFFLQGLMSGVVAVNSTNSDRAAGRWFVQETGQRAEGSDGVNLSIAGVYHDEYRREAGGWLILRRRYDPLVRNADGAVTVLPFPTDVPTI